MQFSTFYYLTEVIIPMSISYSKWQRMFDKGMTAKEYGKTHPGTRFRIVKKKSGETVKGSEDKELDDALKMLRAIKVNQLDL